MIRLFQSLRVKVQESQKAGAAEVKPYGGQEKKKETYSKLDFKQIPLRFGRNSGNRISGITGIFVARIKIFEKALLREELDTSLITN